MTDQSLCCLNLPFLNWSYSGYAIDYYYDEEDGLNWLQVTKVRLKKWLLKIGKLFIQSSSDDGNETYWGDSSSSSVGNIDFISSEIVGTNFKRAKFSSISFESAVIMDSNFSEVIFKGRNDFRNATFQNIDMRVHHSSNFSKAIFTGTKFRNVIVDGMDFGANKTIKAQQLADTCICIGPMPKINGKIVVVKTCPKRRRCSLDELPKF